MNMKETGQTQRERILFLHLPLIVLTTQLRHHFTTYQENGYHWNRQKSGFIVLVEELGSLSLIRFVPQY